MLFILNQLNGVAVAMNKSVRSVGICPFDELPCEHIDSCDDAMALYFGLLLPHNCTHAVVKVGKK